MATTVPSYVVGNTRAFQVPSNVLSQSPGAQTSEVHVVFLLDASGSMVYHWAAVACGVNEFCAKRVNSHMVKFADGGAVRTSPLKEDLDECRDVDTSHGCHVGFGTNITEGVAALRKHLADLVARGLREFAVVFVSDGEGDIEGLEEECKDIQENVLARNNATAEFTTIGVGCCFPTAVAMTVRNAIHGGRESVPLVTLIEDPDEFQEALDGISCYLPTESASAYARGAKVKASPWGEDASRICADVWYMTDKEDSEISLVWSENAGAEDATTVRFSELPWTEKELAGVARQLMWQLQVMSLRNKMPREDIRANAQRALELVEAAGEKVEVGVEVEVRGSGSKRATVYERLLRKKEKSVALLIVKLKKELRLLAKESLLSGLGDEELAKRLAIGTMEGKYHQRAVRWKGLSANDFRCRRDGFVSLLEDEEKMELLQGAIAEGKAQGLVSAVSLESNADVLLQENLSEAICMLESQFSLVEDVPLVGIAVKVCRSAGSMISPWTLRVQGMSGLTPVIDTVSLVSLDTSGNLGEGVHAKLSAGNDEVETVNAICSVVASPKHAQALRPFLTSELYEILHTYTACGNADTVDSNSHCALLGGTLCFLLDQNHERPSHQSWLDMIMLTIRELYPWRGLVGRSFLSRLVVSPCDAVVTAYGSLQCESMSKPIALALSWKDSIAIESRPDIVRHILKEWAGRALGSRRDVADWFTLCGSRVVCSGPGGTESDVESVVSCVDVGSYYLPWEAVNAALMHVSNTTFAVREAGKPVFDFEKFTKKCFAGPVSFRTVEQFGRVFLEDPSWQISENDAKVYVFHGLRHAASLDRRTEATQDVDGLVMAELKGRLERSAASQFCMHVRATVENKWHAAFDPAHSDVVAALSLSDILQKREEMGLPYAPPQDLRYREGVGLCSAVCMARECPFFLHVKGKSAAAAHYTAAAKRRGGNVVSLSRAVAACVRKGETNCKEILKSVGSGEYIQYQDDEPRKRKLKIAIDTKEMEVLADIAEMVSEYTRI